MTELERIRIDMQKAGFIVKDGLVDDTTTSRSKAMRPSLEMYKNDEHIFSLVFSKAGNLNLLIAGIEGSDSYSWLNIKSNPKYLTDDERTKFEEGF